MNIQHMRYAMEVDRHGSISRAAEALYMNQPNLSKAIRELEGSLGITIFKRNSKGVAATQEGERFLSYARGVLAKIDEMEALYRPGSESRQVFRVSAPHSVYIARAFAALAAGLDADAQAALHFSEAGAMQVVRNITDRDYKLGVIRCRAADEVYYSGYLRERELEHSQLLSFDCAILLHRHDPLAEKNLLHIDDLGGHSEIVFEDALASGLQFGDRGGARSGEELRRLLCVGNRGSMMDLLSANVGGFAWAEPIPKEYLERYSLVQKKCGGINMHHKDMLVYPRGYGFSHIEKAFIAKLEQISVEVRQDLLKTSL